VKNVIGVVIFSFISCFSSLVLSAESVLLTINRKDNGRINHLFLKTNSQDQLSEVYLDLPGPSKAYDATDIRNGTGIYFQKGIPIIFLKSSDLDISLGGNISLKYLKEYKIVGENVYKVIPLRIGKDDDGKWALFKNGVKVQKALTFPYTWGIKKFILE